MEEDYQPNRGMWACFPCLELWRWGRKRLAGNDPEHEPLFPPPDTILTPPRRKRPNLPNLSSSASSGSIPVWQSQPNSPTNSKSGYGGVRRNGSSSKLSQEGRERMGSISRAYAGRMQSLEPPRSIHSIPSTPSIPTTPHHPGGPTIRPLSAINPLSQSTSSRFDSESNPISPYRPAAANLGRSASEPRNLSDLGDFAPHQIPAFSSISVGRGGGRGRKRSATTSERLSSPLAIPERKEGDRGRSPGPSRLHQTNEEQQKENDGRYIPMGRSLSHPEITTSRLDELNEILHHPGAQQEEEEEEGVVKKDLGLRGLHSIRGGKRGKGRGGKRIRTD